MRDVQPYGVFVDIGGIDGLVHISELPDEWKANLSLFGLRGRNIEVKVLKIDDRGRISLSARNLS